MGGGHITRPNFGYTQMDSMNPMSEFYALLLHGLEKAKSFALPGCYASFRPDFSRPIWREDLPEYCHYSPQPGGGAVTVIQEEKFPLGCFEPSLTVNGAPIAVFLENPDWHRRLAVRLLPPFGTDELPAPPKDVPLVELEITVQDLTQIDENPAALANRWMTSAENKHWAASSKIDAFELKALAAAQKEYARLHNFKK